MLEPYKKLAAILRTTPEVLYELDGKMSKITGQDGVMESIANQNDALVSKTLAELSLTRNATAEEVYTALIRRLVDLDQNLYELLDKPDLSKMSLTCGKLCETASKLSSLCLESVIRKKRKSAFEGVYFFDQSLVGLHISVISPAKQFV